MRVPDFPALPPERVSSTIAVTRVVPWLRALLPYCGPCPKADQTAGLVESGHPQGSTNRPTRGYAFSSRLSSSRKRQSVWSAMSSFGLDRIRPASCSRIA